MSLWLSTVASAQTSFQWLNDAVHPRDMALANASVAAVNPSGALGLNPAGLRWTPFSAGPRRGFQLGLRHYPAGITQQMTQIVFPFGAQLVGVEIRCFDYGTFPGYDDEGQRQADDYTAIDLLLRGGVMHRVGRDLVVGAAVGAVYSRLEKATAWAGLWSLGVQLDVAPLSARLGVVVQNQGWFIAPFGSTLPDELPATWLVGLAKSLAHLPLTLHVSAGKNVATGQLLWRLGGEFRLPWRLVLRLGVDQSKLDYRRGQAYSDLLSGFSLGFGTTAGGVDVSAAGNRQRPAGLSLDGAVKFLGPLGFSTSLALGLRF